MKQVTAATLLVMLVGLLVLGGCAEERTLVSRKYVIEGLERPYDGGRSTTVGRSRAEPPKYREHWWQFWRKPMPEDVRIAREERLRQTTRNKFGGSR